LIVIGGQNGVDSSGNAVSDIGDQARQASATYRPA
jgi:hypothetical protein